MRGASAFKSGRSCDVLRRREANEKACLISWQHRKEERDLKPGLTDHGKLLWRETRRKIEPRFKGLVSREVGYGSLISLSLKKNYSGFFC